MHFSVIPGHCMTPALISRWEGLRASNPTLRSPFFCWGFTEAVMNVRDDVFVGMVENLSGEVVAFLPFQLEKRFTAKPIGYPYSDYHGVVKSNELAVDPRMLLRGFDLKLFEFRYLPTDQAGFRPFVTFHEDSPVVDLNRFKLRGTEGRKMRKLNREIGPLRFESHVDHPQVLQELIEWKRFHYRRTGHPDILKDTWLRELLHALHRVNTPRFAGRLSVLYAGDRLIAAHLGLRSSKVWHWWFPSYHPELSKYSPGLLMLMHLIEHAQEIGMKEFDFGPGVEAFKQRFANASVSVGRGFVALSPWESIVRHSRAIARNVIVNSPLDRPLRSAARWFRD